MACFEKKGRNGSVRIGVGGREGGPVLGLVRMWEQMFQLVIEVVLNLVNISSEMRNLVHVGVMGTGRSPCAVLWDYVAVFWEKGCVTDISGEGGRPLNINPFIESCAF